MAVEFKLPELGENIEEAEVAELLVSEGDTVEAEQPVMELETEKAVVELPCPHAGVVSKIHVSEGDTIQVGSVVLTIEEESAAPAEDEQTTADKSAQEQEKTAAEPQEQSEEQPKQRKAAPAADTQREAPQRDKGNERKRTPTAAESRHAAPPADTTEVAEWEQTEPPPPAGPATRFLARKLGVDLHQVQGTGSGGRITQEDVEAYVRDLTQRNGAGGVAPPPLPDFEQYGPVERERLSKLNRTAVDQLSTSWGVIPHVTQHDLADVTELEAARKRYMQTLGADGPKITVTAVAVKACARLLHVFPRFNSSLDAGQGQLVLKKYYHIGVAVDTEHGLVVPVIRDADRKTLADIADELIDLAEKARNRKLDLSDMQAATFTITNLGGIGGTAFTPIVNYPEVAILGISRTQPQLVMTEGELQQRQMLPLSLSYDHRVINGADAARFVVHLKTALQDPFALLAQC